MRAAARASCSPAPAWNGRAATISTSPAKSTTRGPRRCRADDLSGLPPALIYTAGFDPLRDEGQAYADRLAAAGVKTIHREFESLIHGFVGMRGALQAAARAMDDMVAGLRHELAQLGR